MKTLLAILAGAGVTAGALNVFAQEQVAPAPPVAPAAPVVIAVPTTPAETLKMLQSIRDQNARLLEQQAATLKLLEEMEKTSTQLKFFGKRS